MLAAGFCDGCYVSKEAKASSRLKHCILSDMLHIPPHTQTRALARIGACTCCSLAHQGTAGTRSVQVACAGG